MKLKPKRCPICGGKLRRWKQRFRVMTRRRGSSERARYFHVCTPCDVRVVLHKHRRVP